MLSEIRLAARASLHTSQPDIGEHAAAAASYRPACSLRIRAIRRPSMIGAVSRRNRANRTPRDEWLPLTATESRAAHAPRPEARHTGRVAL